MILGALGDGDSADDLLNQALSAEFGEDFSDIPDEDIDYAAFFLQCPPYPSSSDKEDDFFHIEWDKDKTYSTSVF